MWKNASIRLTIYFKPRKTLLRFHQWLASRKNQGSRSANSLSMSSCNLQNWSKNKKSLLIFALTWTKLGKHLITSSKSLIISSILKIRWTNPPLGPILCMHYWAWLLEIQSRIILIWLKFIPSLKKNMVPIWLALSKNLSSLIFNQPKFPHSWAAIWQREPKLIITQLLLKAIFKTWTILAKYLPMTSFQSLTLAWTKAYKK